MHCRFLKFKFILMSELETIKEIRELTGAGIADIKKALAEAGGDREKALEKLRIIGKSVAEKKSGRNAKDGLIEAYIHSSKKVGVLLELRCETDFVARNEEFQKLAHEIALQIAATDPKYLKPEDIPQEIIDQETKIYSAQIDPSKPKNMAENILKGKLEKRWSELCLLNQEYIRDSNMKIQDLISQATAKLGEKIEIGQFARFSI